MLKGHHSVVLNAKSRFYDILQTNFNNSHEDVLFPLDAKVLLTNCLDFPSRVRKASRNGLAIANFFSRQSCIENVYYPTMVTSAPLYERYRRPNGGYGCLLSLVFKRAESAVKFYNSVDCCKGPTFGTNFTLVLPYSQLAHAGELDWAESAGHLAKHIVRISAGIEDKEILIAKFSRALQEVEALEME
jgi:cystathionine gamma-synthase